MMKIVGCFFLFVIMMISIGPILASEPDEGGIGGTGHADAVGRPDIVELPETPERIERFERPELGIEIEGSAVPTLEADSVPDRIEEPPAEVAP